ncbi:MAG: hypothetical protein ACXAB2_13705 [Candidatus Hodarchaeales archaeon]
METPTEKQARKLWKILDSVYFYSLSTCTENLPQSTMIQPALTKEWQFLVISDSGTKKVRNIKENSNVWLIADKTGMFKIPKCIYIRGTAIVSQLTEKKFEFVLSHHGWLTRRIFRSLTKNGYSKSSLIEITPTK